MRLSEHHLPGDVTAPARSRRLIEAWAAEHPRRHEIVLALSELVANAVIHAANETRERGVAIRFEERDSCVRIAVGQPGPVFSPTIRHQHSGLALVTGSVDRWGIDQNGASIEVWFEVDNDSES